MAIKIDHPTPTEWVVQDSAALTHFYAFVTEVQAERHQLIITELGVRKSGFYAFVREVYSCTFFAESPEYLVGYILRQFSQCRDRAHPVELLFVYGGTTEHPMVTNKVYSGVLQ